MYITKTSKNWSQISLNEIKEDLAIDTSDTRMDQQLRRLIKSAIAAAEDFVHDDIVTTSCVLEEASYICPFSYLNYIVPAVNATITGITLTVNDVSTSISTSDYYVERYNNYTLIKFKNAITGNKLVIRYQSGYADIPAAIRRAISIKIGEMLDVDRNGYVANNLIASKAFQRLLSPYTVLV